MTVSKYYREIYEYLNSIPIYDTHEHLAPCEAAREKETDILREYLRHYMASSVISAGLSQKDFLYVRDASKPLMERWNMVEPYWEYNRHTGYGQAIDISVKKLYGYDAFNKENLSALNEAFLKTLKQDDYFGYILKDICHIRKSILDPQVGSIQEIKGYPFDFNYFAPVLRVDSFVCPQDTLQIYEREQETGITVRDLDSYVEMCIAYMDELLSKGGYIGLKCALAYKRTLEFDRVSKYEAEKAYNAVRNDMSDMKRNYGIAFSKCLQDYIMREIMKYADSKNLFMQVHTGMFEGNHNTIQNARPAHLTTLILDYPHVTFDIFHIGYPWTSEIVAMAKMLPNVVADMAWAHIISPKKSVDALSDMLDAVPANKIFGFGGDYAIIDCVVGHKELAVRNISRALAEKVNDGYMDVARAKEIGRLILHDNPKNLYFGK